MNVCFTALKREFDKITVIRSVKSTCDTAGDYEIMVSSSSGNVS